MSFREKSAWVTLIAILIVSAMYVFHVPRLYVPHAGWVLKALRIAAYTYIAGSFIAIFMTLHVIGASPGMVGVAVLLAFVLAEIVNYAARIVYYRRNA